MHCWERQSPLRCSEPSTPLWGRSTVCTSVALACCSPPSSSSASCLTVSPACWNDGGCGRAARGGASEARRTLAEGGECRLCGLSGLSARLSVDDRRVQHWQHRVLHGDLPHGAQSRHDLGEGRHPQLRPDRILRHRRVSLWDLHAERDWLRSHLDRDPCGSPCWWDRRGRPRLPPV